MSLVCSHSGTQTEEGSTMLKLHNLECADFLRTPGDLFMFFLKIIPVTSTHNSFTTWHYLTTRGGKVLLSCPKGRENKILVSTSNSYLTF